MLEKCTRKDDLDDLDLPDLISVTSTEEESEEESSVEATNPPSDQSSSSLALWRSSRIHNQVKSYSDPETEKPNTHHARKAKSAKSKYNGADLDYSPGADVNNDATSAKAASHPNEKYCYTAFYERKEKKVTGETAPKFIGTNDELIALFCREITKPSEYVSDTTIPIAEPSDANRAACTRASSKATKIYYKKFTPVLSDTEISEQGIFSNDMCYVCAKKKKEEEGIEFLEKACANACGKECLGRMKLCKECVNDRECKSCGESRTYRGKSHCLECITKGVRDQGKVCTRPSTLSVGYPNLVLPNSLKIRLS